MKHLFVVVTLIVSSFLFNSALFLLGIRRIDPVIYTAPQRSTEPYPQTQLALSAAGATMWIIVAALFSLAVAVVLKRTFTRPWLYALSVFLMTLPYLAVIHPHFLLVTLGAGTRESLESLLRDTAFYSYYFGNGFYRFRLVLPFAYAFFMYVLLPVGRPRLNPRPLLEGGAN